MLEVIQCSLILFLFWGSCVLLKQQEVKVLKSLLLSFVVEAEKIYGYGSGEVKFSLVSDWVYQSIPSFLKPLFSAEDLEYLIEEALLKGEYLWDRDYFLQEYLGKEEYY